MTLHCLDVGSKPALAARSAREAGVARPLVRQNFSDHELHAPRGWRSLLGEDLSGIALNFRMMGNPAGPSILVLGGISAGRSVATCGADAGWWPDMVGAGRPIDCNRFRVISADFFPTGPVGPLRLCPADYADLYHYALQQLGVARLDAVVGASFGGMIALALAERRPEFVQRIIVACAAHRPSAIGVAWRRIQQRILAFAAEVGRPEDGVAIARELAMTTYRTPAEFNARFSEPAQVASYLAARGGAYAACMSNERYATLSAAIDRHDATPERITASALLLAVDSDLLAPLADISELARRLGGACRLEVISSRYGHDAFLKEPHLVGPPIKAFLKELL